MTRGSLIVLGTSSGAGKSTVVTALCRSMARRGVSVAPFKAQNMSLNSFVTLQGEEIGRAQATQARAAFLEPEAAMNPVLLKPGSDSSSQLIVLGHPAGEVAGSNGWAAKAALLDLVVETHRSLMRRFDVVLCEGAGSPAEINLRASDIVNLGFARAAGIPAILVGDIDPGGVFAALTGTLALLSGEDQDVIRGFIINRFRGDLSLLHDGVEMLGQLTGRPTLGVLPYLAGIGVDAEDALDLGMFRNPAPPLGTDVLRIAVIRLPCASNLTDLDPLASEPGVVIRFITRPEELADADLVIIPGTRTTISDLAWMRRRGFAQSLETRAAQRLPILGICGGFQILGEQIVDGVESDVEWSEGLGLLPVRTVFEKEKLLARPERFMNDGSILRGYEIHHGRVTLFGGDPLFADEGCRVHHTAGTSWHGLFENDVLRRSYLSDVATAAGRDFQPSRDVVFEQVREDRIERLADWVDAHLNLSALLKTMEAGTKPAPRLNLSLQPHERNDGEDATFPL